MANYFRLIAFVLLAFIGSSASAAVPLADSYCVNYSDHCTRLGYFPTMSAACSATGASIESEHRKYSVDVSAGTCKLSRVDRPDDFYNFSFNYKSSCPANSSPAQIGGGCTCSSGYFEQGGQCVSAEDPDQKCAGDFNMAGFGVGIGTLTDSVTLKGEVASGGMCHPYSSPTSGCMVRFVADKVVQMPDGSKQTIGRYGMYSGPGPVQGKACDIPAEQPGEGTEVDANCKKSGYAGSESVGGRKVCLDAPECPGGFGGEVNGVEVCVKDEGTNIVKSEKKSEKKNADGSTEQKTEKTTCQGKECKTETTTTTTPAGGGSSTTNVTNVSQSKDDYCKSNADSAQCKGDSNGDGKDSGGSFGGSCEGGFTCEGDALQCAQLREQYKRNCEMMDKDKDTNSLTNKALNGTDDKSADALKASAGQVNVGSTFDQSGLGWSHSCPADPRIPLGFGGSNSEFTIPFSRICGPLGVLSLAGVGITLLGCGVWVLGGKKEG